jgi:hypothetical protein
MTREVRAVAIADAVARRRIVADGPGDLNDDWLSDGQRVAMPEESGRHLEPAESRRLEFALRSSGVDALTAIVNDALVLDELVYELDARSEDLSAFSSEFSGMNALLLPRVGTDLAILFSTDDYHLVAGPSQFVAAYFGDIGAARQAFLDFVENHFEAMQSPLQRVVRYMSWANGRR